MTVSTTTSRWEYTGDNSTKIFAYTNKIFVDGDLDVYSDNVLQTLTTHYTVSGAGVVTGGNVTYVTAPASAVQVVIIRDVADTQATDYPAGGSLPSGVIEDDIDRRTIISQQQEEMFSRTMLAPAGEVQINMALPTVADRLSKSLQFDSAGKPVAMTLSDASGTNVTATGSTTARSLAERFSDVFNVRDDGAKINGTTDDAAAIQRALDAANSAGGGVVVFDGQGTSIVGTKLTVGSNTKVVIEMGVTVKAKASLDDKLFENKDISSGNSFIIFTGGGTIDGNKANQTSEIEGTGIKLVKVSDVLIENITIINTEGHGIHISNGGNTLENIRFSNVVVKSAGSSAGSSFGTGFSFTDCLDVSLSNCRVYDCFKAGFRPSGTGFNFTNCIARRNKLGGIDPDSTNFFDSTINGGIYSDSDTVKGDGIRLIDAHRIILNGVNCHDNDGAGLMMLNGCTNIVVTGGIFRSNGKSGDAPSDTEGRDGITITNSGGVGNKNIGITIVGARCYDTQGTKTQDYGISVRDEATDVTIDACDLRDNQTGTFFNNSLGLDVRVASNNRGLTYSDVDNTNAALTGSTNETDLKTTTVVANQFGRRNGFRIVAAGTIAGTNDIKTVKLKIGAFAVTILLENAGATDDWMLVCEVWNNEVNSQRILMRSWQAAAAETSGTGYFSTTQDFSSNVIVKLTGQLANTGDTITQTMWRIEPIQ